jgi:ATP-dependent Clp protease ATP-binding subunit ClpA
MKRFERFNIKSRRSVILAILKYDDCFYDSGLRKYDFNEALHVYLKGNGYKTIVFFSKAEGFFSYEKEMLESFFDDKEEAQVNVALHTEDDAFVDDLTGLSTLHVDYDLKPREDSSRRFLIPKESFWQEQTIGEQDSQIVDMKKGLKSIDNCVIVVDPSSNEFSSVFFEQLTSMLKHGKKKKKNHLILLVSTNMHLDKIPTNMLRTNSVFLSDQYFKDQLFNEKFDEKSRNTFYELNESTNYIVPSPTKDDIRNAFQYWRIVENKQFKTKWHEVEELLVQLSSTRGDRGEYLTQSLDQWEDYFENMEEISIDTFESFGVHKVDDSKTVKFDKERLINDLKAVKGQQDNMVVITDAINTWIQKKKKSKPIVFMFAGTSGTGKTYTAKNIQESLADDGYSFVRLNMNEYHSEADAWKLLGSATGYSGSDKDAPLFKARKKSDKLVILFDEIEKAHPSLFTTIMSLMDEGTLADGKGENYDFRQSVIIFTTNLAMERLLETKRTLMAAGSHITSNNFQETTRKILKDNKLPNEICGRINWLLIYNTLGVSEIVQISLEQIRKLGREYDIKINLVSKTYLREIAEQCSGSNEGARPVRRNIESKIEPILQRASKSGLFSSDKLYDIDDGMHIVESANTEIVEQILIDFETSKTVKFDKERLINDLKAVKGQQDNIVVITDAINTWIRKKKKTKPIVFMFAGTSGTGKTFTAQTIQSSLFGEGYKFVRLDMSEYQNAADTWKLLGSATGHVGSETDAPLFAARKMSDKLVILFDEIEKAHPSLFTTIMSLMDEGNLADGRGVNYDFAQSVIVFTTNLAMDRLIETKKALYTKDIQITTNEFQEATRKILKDSGLRNEICGRIDWLLVYNTLGALDIVQIALEQIRKLGREYDLMINLVSKTYLRKIAEQCSGSNEGARPVRREIDSKIEPLFQEAYESNKYSSNKLYDIDENMQLVESESAEIKDIEIID